jgi:uncharacterized lipoprotein YehR (DUF1307 family)
MRKSISVILALVCALSLAGCSTNKSEIVTDNSVNTSTPDVKNDDSPNILEEMGDKNKDDIELYTITGRYCISTNGTNILLSKDNGAICIRPANNDELFSDLEIGDEIEISISDIEETYPAQTTVYSYTLIKKGTVEDLDTDEIQELETLGWKFSFEVETQ